MRYLQTIILLIFVCSISSLSAQKKGKLTAEEKENLKTSIVKLYRFEAPPLNIMTPKDAVGKGLISDLTKSDKAESQGRHRFYPNKLVQKNLDSLLKAEGVMTNLELIEEPYEFMMPAALKDLSRYNDTEADYIIELIVPLMAWQASYSPTKWRQYWLNLGVEVRIIRKSDLVRIWKTNVGHGGIKDERLKFHINDMEENGKEKISEMLNIAAMECAKKIVANYVAAKK